MWLKFVPADIMAHVRIVCPRAMASRAEVRRQTLMEFGRICLRRKMIPVTMYSIIAAELAMVYAEPFCENRKEDMDAAGGLYRAVVQNSRKWKTDRRVMKRGRRQSGDDFSARRYRALAKDRTRATPRKKERIAMPESDFGCPGRYCLA